jgi:hypothetical protein
MDHSTDEPPGLAVTRPSPREALVHWLAHHLDHITMKMGAPLREFDATCADAQWLLTRLEDRARGDRSIGAGYVDNSPTSVLRDLAAQAERDYVEAVVAAQGCTAGAEADYWRWNGHAEAQRAVATRLRRLLGDPVPAYGSKSWRGSLGADKPETGRRAKTPEPIGDSGIPD